ncbi:MAG TPA: RNA polymerase sigma factor [Jatrophihabitans sp.]|nr:RNA polymerase sigma factor [Jatrophihabitans sp.]
MSGGGPDEEAARRAVEAVWRIEAARVIAGLARVVGDVGRAEDLAQDALVAALEQWPVAGVPDNPGAWLTAVARRRWIDSVRREVSYERKLDQLAHTEGQVETPMDDIEIGPTVSDDVLRLMFTACHPVLPAPARAALTLKLVAGLSTEQIARAYLVPASTMAQRIVRAKRTLATAGVRLEMPAGDELAGRLGTVLEVVYLVFNEGYTATSGASWTRPVLCEEAMRLGRMLAALAPAEAEVLGLVALMEIQASRLRARVAADGSPITLLDQDRSKWDRLLITHALEALKRASVLAQPGGTYLLQAEIAACHARAATADATDWPRIASMYALLAARTGSPVVELNRAVAVSMADGPQAALPIVDSLAEVAALRNYHLLPAVRGDLLVKLGRSAEARAEFLRAAELTANERERTLLRSRADACAPGATRCGRR